LQLDAEDFRLPIRIDGAGRSTGGGLFSRGHVYKLLSNPIYVGRIAHKGQVHEGQHPPIVPQELWDQVQQRLGDHLGAARTKRTRPFVRVRSDVRRGFLCDPRLIVRRFLLEP
jgi:site-specific DNA recombinase